MAFTRQECTMQVGTGTDGQTARWDMRRWPEDKEGGSNRWMSLRSMFVGRPREGGATN